MALQIKEYGIYERRDGVIVSWEETDQFDMAVPFKVGGHWYPRDGAMFGVQDSPLDLIREIVVGPGWMPHNGGENPAPGKVVEVAYRCGVVKTHASENLVWHRMDSSETWEFDILAYRIVEEAAEPAKEDDAAKPVIEPQFFREKAPAKLRAGLPIHFNIDRALNGGFVVSREISEDRIGVLAAFSNEADLLAWLTEQPT